jgi:hypothetical protein
MQEVRMNDVKNVWQNQAREFQNVSLNQLENNCGACIEKFACRPR